MKITVMSRQKAIEYCSEAHRVKSAIISISDPRVEYDAAPQKTQENKVAGILRLCFSDADRPGVDVYGNVVSESDLLSDNDAEKIARFVNRYKDINIIVHCDAGISRSAGVAAAIMSYLWRDDSEIFDSPRYYPNAWCYRKVLNALMKYSRK